MAKEIRLLNRDVIDNTGTAIFLDQKINEGDSEITYVVPIAYIDSLHYAQSKRKYISIGAMEFLNFLSELRHSEKDVMRGAQINDRIILRVGLSEETQNFQNKVDEENHMLKLANNIKEKYKDSELFIVSQQKATRASFRLRGFNAKDFQYEVWNPDIVREGVLFINQWSDSKLKGILTERKFDKKTVPLLEEILNQSLKPNQFLKLFGRDSKTYCYLQVTINKNNEKHLEPIKINQYHKKSLQGITPRNDEQALLLRLLEGCDVVGVHGTAGSGKTILGLAYLTHLNQEGKIERILITKPIVGIGDKIGYTKGDKINKLRQWFGNFIDNIPKLDVYKENQNKIPNLLYDEWGELKSLKNMDSGIYELEIAHYIRGRNFSRMGVIIDETQNFTPHDLKALISRMDLGTKLIVIADINQVDIREPGYGPNYNGYISFLKAFWGQPYFGMIDFNETQRHQAAERSQSMLERYTG